MEPMEKIGERLAAALGCDKAEDPLAAMRAKTADEMLAAANPAQGLFGKGDKYGWVVDGWAIPDDPAKLFDEGRYHDVPLIIGSNADEGTIFLKQLPIKRSVGYKLLMKAYFGDDAEKMLEIFPPDEEDISKTLNRFTTISAFVYPARAIARAMSGAKSKIYLYHFTRIPAGAEELGLGAFHGLEISYVFGNPPALYEWKRYDENLSEVMSSAWAEFAATGDPNGEGLPGWPPYTPDKDEYMEFGDMVKMRSGLFARECDLLEKIMSGRKSGGLEGE
jgi:para-nitrobenzyl esterase